jgi:hypothetical protein
MIDWVTIKGAVKPLISDLMSIPLAQVRWRDEAEASAWTAYPRFDLRILALGTFGYAEDRRSQPTATDDAIVNTVAQKRFTLSVRCDSDCQDLSAVQSGNVQRHAGALMETLKTRLQRQSTRNRIAGVFSITDFQPTRWFDYVDASGRQMSAYVLDLFCATVDNDLDVSPGAGGWINEVTGTGTLDVGTLTYDIKGS